MEGICVIMDPIRVIMEPIRVIMELIRVIMDPIRVIMEPICITAMVSRLVLRCAPSYFCDLCCPVSVLAARRVLRSAVRCELLVPRARLAIMQWLLVHRHGIISLLELRSFLMVQPSQF